MSKILKLTTKEELIENIKKYMKLSDEIRRELTKTEQLIGEEIVSISQWDVSEITDMSSLFEDNHEFNEDISNWDVSNVTTMEKMFCNATSFNQRIRKWNVKNVTTMEKMFFNATSFSSVVEMDVPNLITTSAMFMNATNFNSYVIITNSNKLTDTSSMFENVPFNGFNSHLIINTSNVITMARMFFNSKFNQELIIDITNVTTMESMFEQSDFNQDITDWDISDKNTHNMFKDAPILEENKPFEIVVEVPEVTLSAVTKSITIYIDMHGMNLPDKLPTTILNTIIGGSPGLCTFKQTHDTMDKTLMKIDRLKRIYQGQKISDANTIYSKEFSGLKNLGFLRDDSHKLIPSITPTSWTWPKARNEYFKRRYSFDYLRSYIHDRLFSYEDDASAVTMGIYVIDNKEYSDISLKYAVMSKFTPERQERIGTLDLYQQLQKQNLLNVNVAKQWARGGFDLPFTTEYTTIEHYKEIKLSHILDFFKSLGYDHVNIIDEGCRMERGITPELRRAHSVEEKTLYRRNLNKYKFGGKTRKYKRKTQMKKSKRKYTR